MTRSHMWGALALMVFVVPIFAFADTATSTLQQQIDSQQAQITQLDQEIAQYQTQLNAVSSKKQTLQTQLDQLNLSIKKTTASIQLLQRQIAATKLQIQQLAGGIADKQSSIDTENAGLGQSLRRLDQNDRNSLAVLMLSADGIAGAWKDVNAATQLQTAVGDHVQTLASEKQDLTDTKTASEQKQAQLVQQQKALLAQQGSLNAQKNAQNDLLTQTKSQESTYQQIIAQKKAQETEAQADLFRLSQQLAAADTSKVPTGSHGILSWPLDSIRVTQLFGKTSDSGRLYASGTHNGVDFAADIGTPVHAALSGTVLDVNFITAAQDKKIGYCQYGSWVLIKHANGLATLYAHLSQVSVSKGQTVSTGELIGYSGNTGYAIGPHLHFGVYNASSVTFENYKCNSGYSVHIPVAPTNGYLDPMSYLPPN